VGRRSQCLPLCALYSSYSYSLNLQLLKTSYGFAGLSKPTSLNYIENKSGPTHKNVGAAIEED
jgi:hypothetical protein